MKNYLEERQAELRKRGQGGFTLMEMLIVVAIIAVLIAIAIPVFTNQLENARDATSVANIRSAYAEAQAAYLTGAGETGITITRVDENDSNSKISSIAVSGVKIESLVQNDWSGKGVDLPFYAQMGNKHGDTGQAITDATVTFTYGTGKNNTGTITKVTIAATVTS